MENTIRTLIFGATAIVSGVVASLVFMFPDALEPYRRVGLSLASAHLAVILTLLALHFKGWPLRTVSRLLVLWLFLASTVHLFMQEHVFTPYYAWAPVLVVLCAYLVDLRAAMLLAGVSLLQLTTFVLILRKDHGPFPFLAHRDYFAIFQLATVISAEILMGLMAFSLEYLRDKTERSLLKQRVSATRLARLVETGELFQSIQRNFEPELVALDHTLSRLQSLQQQPANNPTDTQHQLRRLQSTLGNFEDLLKSLHDHAITDDEPQRRIPVLELFQCLHKEVQNEFRLHQVQIRFADHTNNGLINGKLNLIMQVLRALITNSMEALDQQEIRRITIESEYVGAALVIAVRDNGPGVPREWRDKIWRPFFSGKKSAYARGLGLTLGVDIMTEHGGTLTLEPHPHETCFMMKFPRVEELNVAAHI